MRDDTLIALGLHYPDLADELRREMVRTCENHEGQPTREDFIADIARRFTTMAGEAD